MDKSVVEFVPSPPGHWVGDGFPVRSLFTYDGRHPVSPFLLLDYAGPVEFSPTERRRGVGEHPHRGFETVTIVYAGEVEHRDSAGHGGVIGPGDVQWMTAGGGILHEEFHSAEFARRGGTLEMVQLWVNLPARHKMTRPRYQALAAAAIPSVPLPDDAGHVRVIAGAHAGREGAASTFSELNVWDVQLRAGGAATLPVPAGHNTLVVVLKGEVAVGESRLAGAAELLVLDPAGTVVSLRAAAAGASLLVLSGAPIDEPLVGYGPFVMNSRADIEAAIEDFRSGRFGALPTM